MDFLVGDGDLQIMSLLGYVVTTTKGQIFLSIAISL
jgi:hypothetical protein